MTKWVVLWFGEGNLVQCQEFYLNQPWGSCYLFLPKKHPQNLPLLPSYTASRAPSLDAPTSRDRQSDFGLLQALTQVLPRFPVLWCTGTPSRLHFPYWPLLSAFPGKTPSRLIATDVPCSGLLYPVARKSPIQLFSTAIQDCSGLPSTTSYWYSGTAA